MALPRGVKAARRDAKVARTMFEDAEQTLARSAAALRWPETAALQSAVGGQLISLGGAMAGLRMGAKSLRLLDEAVAAGPENPRVWMLKGVSDLFRPKLFGGSAEKAEVSLKRALALFDKDAPASPAPWWGHAEAYGWLGQVYVKQGRLEEAVRGRGNEKIGILVHVKGRLETVKNEVSGGKKKSVVTKSGGKVVKL